MYNKKDRKYDQGMFVKTNLISGIFQCQSLRQTSYGDYIFVEQNDSEVLAQKYTMYIDKKYKQRIRLNFSRIESNEIKNSSALEGNFYWTL